MKKIASLLLSGLFVSSLVLSSLGRTSVSAEGTAQTSSPVQEFEINHYDVAQTQLNFDDHWKFFLGEAQGAEQVAFQDGSWQNISLPHDYSLTQEYTTNGEAESGYKMGGIGWYRKQFTLGPAYAGKKIYLHFDGAYMLAEVYVNGQKVAFHPYGYTAFTVDITEQINVTGINHVAVKTNNPVPTSRWYSGSGLYRSVYLEAYEPIHFEKYGVKLTTPDLNDHNRDQVSLKVETKILNETENTKNQLAVRVKLYDGDQLLQEQSSAVGTEVAGSSSAQHSLTLTGLNPRLWDITDPHLYRVVVELLDEDRVVDTYEKDYGFRFFNFDRNTGFSLNGRPVKLKGVSMHHDQGGLGASAYYDAIERQVLLLKDMGVNSIRVTHNPSARHLKDIANKQGILLIDEAFDTWSNRKNGNHNDYSVWFKKTIDAPLKLLGARADQTWAEYDVKQMTKEGLNDASIIMWSLGNEIFEGLNTWNIGDYPQIATQLSTWVDEIDGTRYVTFGDNKIKGHDRNAVNVANAIANKAGNLKGIIGYNYADGGQYQGGFASYPNWIIYGSETASSINSRGTYTYTQRNGQFETPGKDLSSYDERRVPWGHTAKQAWYDVITKDYVAGEYVWTGFDYLGEPTPWNNTGRGATGGWPSPKSSYFGIIDTAGFPKDSFYFYQSQWNDHVNTLHILPQWQEGQVTTVGGNVRVVVYSDAAAVELFRVTEEGLRGESLGRKEFTKVQTPAGHSYQYHESDNYRGLELVWQVPYMAGGLEAVAYNAQGEEITETKGNRSVHNYGAPSKLSASVNKQSIEAKKQNLFYVEIDVKDANDRFVANANPVVYVQVSGPARLVALDNGHQVDHQSYQDNNRKAFAGKLVAIVESTGEAGQIQVTATSQGLEASTVTVQARASASTNTTSNPIVKVAYAPIVYIKKANDLILPEQVTVIREDGSREQVRVEWNRPSNLSELLAQPQTFTVTGQAEGLGAPIALNIVVLDKVAALLNYSTATLVGQAITLPESRKAVDSEGNLLDVNFPVQWDSIDASQFEQAHTFVVQGRASVFGDELPVSASIRVTEASLTQGGNVARAAILSEDTPEHQKSDTLSAIIDGNKTYRVNYASTNPHAWSNYNRAQAGVDHSTLTFRFDTAQNLNKAVVYYFTDTWATALPREVQWSYNMGNGDDINIQATASAVSMENNLSKIEYTFDRPLPVVVLNAKIFNNERSPRSNTEATTGIYEVELYTASENLEKGHEARLDRLSINGKAVSPRENMSIEALRADTEQSAVANGAITILPAYNKKVVILVEAEDQSKLSKYVIHLGEEEQLTPEDDARSLTKDEIRLEAGSEEPRADQLVGNANDGNGNTIWHSRWSGDHLDNLYAIVEVLEDDVSIEALRYLPRQGSGDGDNNGRVKTYKVLSSDDKLTWTEVTEGRWEDDGTWKIASFPQAVKAKYFKLQAVETYGNRPNRYMSAAEITLRKAKVKTAIDGAEVSVDPEVYEYTGKVIVPQVSVTLNGQTLRKDIDYVLELEHNIEPSTDTQLAEVKVKGIADYTGEINKNFKIVKTEKPVREKTYTSPTQPKLSLTAKGKFDEDALTLKIEKLEASEVTNVHEQAAGAQKEQLEVFEATVTGNYDADTIFTVKLPRDTSRQALKVLHIAKGGNIEVFNGANLTGEVIQVEARDLSPFIVVYAKASVVPPTPQPPRPWIDFILPKTQKEEQKDIVPNTSAFKE